jgi:hypothetical protein
LFLPLIFGKLTMKFREINQSLLQITWHFFPIRVITLIVAPGWRDRAGVSGRYSVRIESEGDMESEDVKEDVRKDIEQLKIAQATQAATQAGAVATLSATQAGAVATAAATQAGLLTTIAVGSVSLIVGIFLGLTIINSTPYRGR